MGEHGVIGADVRVDAEIGDINDIAENDVSDEEIKADELEKRMWKDRIKLNRIKEKQELEAQESEKRKNPKKHSDEAQRKRMSRAQDGILEYMLKLMEVCKVRGFVYGIIPEANYEAEYLAMEKLENGNGNSQFVLQDLQDANVPYNNLRDERDDLPEQRRIGVWK